MGYWKKKRKTKNCRGRKKLKREKSCREVKWVSYVVGSGHGGQKPLKKMGSFH